MRRRSAITVSVTSGVVAVAIVAVTLVGPFGSGTQAATTDPVRQQRRTATPTVVRPEASGAPAPAPSRAWTDRPAIDGAPVERLPRGVDTWRYGDESWQVVDIHHGRTRDGRRPALVYVHSGGWIGGSHTDLMDPLADLTGAGFTVASVSYALAPEATHPVAVAEVATAIDWLADNAERLGVDPARIGVVGRSAGGHLALLAVYSGAVHHRVAAVAGVAAIVDVADLADSPDRFFEPTELVSAYLGCRAVPGGLGECSPWAAAAASPVNHVSADAPPTYALFGGQDTLVEPTQAEGLRNAFSAAGIAERLVVDIDPEGNHGVSPAGRPGFRAFLEQVVTAVAAPDATSERRDAEPVDVAFVGDSLSAEVDPYLRTVVAAGRAEYDYLGYPGTAICDWLHAVAAAAVGDRPDVLVALFTGNALTPCMIERTGAPMGIGANRGATFDEDAYVEAYAADTARLVETAVAAGIEVVLVGVPTSEGAEASGLADPRHPVDAVYRDLATSTAGVSYLPVDDALTPGGRFHGSLPCLAGEPGCAPGDVVTVRSDDGGHLCNEGDSGLCHGAWRLAEAIGTALVA